MSIRRILVVGGANGIGLSTATLLAERENTEKVYIVDKVPLADKFRKAKMETFEFDLTSDNYTFFDRFDDIDALMITAGFGRLALFHDVTEEYIISSFEVNTLAVIRLIKHFYHKIESDATFRCGVMVSVAGFMSSPFFSIYGATKAALKIFIESVNVELEKAGMPNRILNVSPGSIRGTSFSQGETDLTLTEPLAKEIITHLEAGDDLFIPQYEEIFRNVFERYYNDFRAEGRHSYEYKLESGRVTPPIRHDR